MMRPLYSGLLQTIITNKLTIVMRLHTLQGSYWSCWTTTGVHKATDVFKVIPPPHRCHCFLHRRLWTPFSSALNHARAPINRSARQPWLVCFIQMRCLLAQCRQCEAIMWSQPAFTSSAALPTQREPMSAWILRLLLEQQGAFVLPGAGDAM